MLIGDQSASPTYTDADLEALIAVPQPDSALPEAVKVMGIAVFQRFPVPDANQAPAWGSLTSDQWSGLTSDQWGQVTP